MIKESTSIHNLNADRGLNNLQKIFYLLSNWANNLFPYANIDENLIISNFICKDFKNHWFRLYLKSSPSRKLSDLFWLKLPWDKIKEELGEINVLDIGCGSGNYGSRLVEYSNNNIMNYTGIDTYKHDNWTSLKERYPNFQFFKIEEDLLSSYIPLNTNFFMSQSVIEHLDDDLHYFKQIKDYILSYGKSVIQVHLFPPSSYLQLYRFHGIRQYTPRTISKITRLFNDSSYTILFKLGGKACNRIHYNFITKPILQRLGDLRDLKTQEYDQRLYMAIEEDMRNLQRFVSFYALIIHSNWKKIFIQDKIY